MTPFLFALPWLGVLVFVLFVVRIPSELPRPSHKSDAPERPSVSVIVPARNESATIESCVRSLTAATYPDFEVIVVDDRSDDGTGALARALDRGNARRLEIVRGEEIPEGWIGKPWACWQGAARAQGELLLFTDADTEHAPELLARAVAGFEEERADLLTVVGRQVMETFWERLVQPQIFMLMLFRFPDFEKTAKNDRWRDAVANGQFMLFSRTSYDAIGGHEAVRDEVVEDLALAQVVKRAGRQLRIRSAETALATRMYRSLGHLVEGWSKNIVTGGLQSFPRWVRPFIAPVSLAIGSALWLAPPLTLATALTGLAGSAVLTWSTVVCATSVVLWGLFSRQMGAPPAYGLLYPLGALVGAYIFARSWIRGGRVEWKGRRYDLPPVSERA